MLHVTVATGSGALGKIKSWSVVAVEAGGWRVKAGELRLESGGWRVEGADYYSKNITSPQSTILLLNNPQGCLRVGPRCASDRTYWLVTHKVTAIDRAMKIK